MYRMLVLRLVKTLSLRYFIRKVKRDEEDIVCERIANHHGGMEECKGPGCLAASRQYGKGNALLGVRHQQEEEEV